MLIKDVQRSVREGKELFMDCKGGIAVIAPYEPKRKQCVCTDNPKDFHLYELNNYEL